LVVSPNLSAQPPPRPPQACTMTLKRRCAAPNRAGEACGAAPLLDSDFCLVHVPPHGDEMAVWRRAGGLNRRREATLATVFDIGNIESVAGLWRIVQIVVLSSLAQENGVARNRILLSAAMTGAKLLETGQQADRLADVETILGIRKKQGRR
jgi:hypothetical protein